MNISLEKLIPLPLRDRLANKVSDIWNEHLLLKQGDFIKIVAPSGTGKTTLMHCLYQLRTDYLGSILFNNKDLQSNSKEQLATLRQENISIIFQDLRLFPQLTARENIELKRILKLPALYEQSRIDEMASKLGISEILDQRIAICSYGEQQRVAIIRALIQPFDWLWMDEPFSHLDDANSQKAAALISEECSKRKAGLLITDLEEDNHFHYSQIYYLSK